MSRNNKRNIIRFLPVYGCIATGIVYATIGVIAMLSFLRIRHGGADESSMLVILTSYLVGRIFIWIILLGTVCYIIWRFYETIKDPYEYGNKITGLAKRTGIALSTIADVLIVYAAIRVLTGTSHVRPDGQPYAERQTVSILMQNYGAWLVIAIGAIYIVTAAIQFLYGVTRGYKERVNIGHLSPFFRNGVHVLAWIGYFGRGIILGITGFFLLKAGLIEDPRYVVNTDKAFDFIGDNLGPVCFIFTATATVCYGFFMLIQGAIYDIDKD